MQKTMRFFLYIFLWAALLNTNGRLAAQELIQSPDSTQSSAALAPAVEEATAQPAEPVKQQATAQPARPVKQQPALRKEEVADKPADLTEEVASEPAATKNIVQKTVADAEEWSLTSGKIIWAAIIFLPAFFIIRFLTSILESLAARWGQSRLLIKRLIPTFRILIWTFVIYEVITLILAPPLETIIALSAAVGLSVGLASQDILKNVFGGIIILLDRPFQVGDKIEAGGHYGEVMQIGLRTVRIVTPDDNLVSIPNADIMNQAVSNANAGEPNCQVVAEVYLPSTVDTEKVREIAYLAAATSRYIFLNKPIAVIIKNEMREGRSLFKVRLKAYVLDIRYEFPFMSEMTETLVKEVLDAGLVTKEQLEWVLEPPAQQD